ncbi:uncharacterized protein LOC131875951 [Cryptomeria japonica]|uniref:uncharacterized protein LOC131875951 n=1 Tax=Cryptomeria japonica TaxID=3369 RepID=UPI0027DA8AE0|nr:uncharacterized protein LOC131875951 [Cryptomeria japonica]
MAKALKRQPDWVLQKLGLERDVIQSPKSNRVDEEKGKGEVTRLTTPRYSPPHMRNLEQPFKVYDNPLSDALDNNYEKKDKWKNTPYHENKKQYNYRQYNNHNGERRTNSGEITGNWNNRDRINNVSNNGANHGNNGNYGNNGNGDNKNGNNSNGGGNNGNIEQCIIAQGFAEEDHENEYEPIVNVLPSNPFWGRDEDSSEGDQSSDVQWRRENQQHSVQQVFINDEADIPSLRRLFHNEEPVHSLRNLTDEEKKSYTVAAVAQAKTNYQLRNRIVNQEQDSGAAVNIMPKDVMKELVMHVETPYGKCYAMDNKLVPVVGIMKNVEFRFQHALIHHIK